MNHRGCHQRRLPKAQYIDGVDELRPRLTDAQQLLAER